METWDELWELLLSDDVAKGVVPPLDLSNRKEAAKQFKQAKVNLNKVPGAGLLYVYFTPWETRDKRFPKKDFVEIMQGLLSTDVNGPQLALSSDEEKEEFRRFCIIFTNYLAGSEQDDFDPDFVAAMRENESEEQAEPPAAESVANEEENFENEDNSGAHETAPTPAPAAEPESDKKTPPPPVPSIDLSEITSMLGRIQRSIGSLSATVEGQTKNIKEIQTDQNKKFNSLNAKLEEQEEKDNIIKGMHSELMEYRNGLKLEIVLPMAKCLILLYRRITNLVAHYQEAFAKMESVPEECSAFLKETSDCASVILSSLKEFDIEMINPEVGTPFSSKKQRCTGTIPKTDDVQPDTIAEVQSVGFEEIMKHRIIDYPEVVIYK